MKPALTKSATAKTPAKAKPALRYVLTINGGSSSIRFAWYEIGEPLTQKIHGKIERVGATGMAFTFCDAIQKTQGQQQLTPAEQKSPVNFLIRWLEANPAFASVEAIGHRVVHGMQHTQPERVTPGLLAELRRTAIYDPEHLPRELALIEALCRRHPKLSQVACFDTAFHQTMPHIAKLLPIPRRYFAKGIQRYGFHGLSYTYLMEELARLGDPTATKGRVILAHLGSGASLAAVRNGKSIDTSMSFTPTAGLVMSTRSGDLDPGLMACLARTQKMTATRFQKMVNHESGLLGISETSSDMRELESRKIHDLRAAEAVELFCYQAKKWIGSFAATLNGLDTLVFAGGIGENSASVRARICGGLDFLGLKLDKSRNARNAMVISTNGSAVKVRVIRTDEELMIARAVCRLLNLNL